MGYHVSHALIWLSKRLPALAKCALWLWVRSYVYFPRDTHWLLPQLAMILNYRIPLSTRLGNGMKIIIPWNDVAGREIHEHGYYEFPTVSFLQKLLKPGMVFFDVGAHVGQYTLIGADLVGPTGSVHSFEPDPDTFRWLARNVKKNHLANVHLNQLALYDGNGSVTLYRSTPENIGSTSLRPPYNYSGYAIQVRCLTLDSYLEMNNVNTVDVMKMDVEGAELRVLQGAKSLLSRKNQPIIILEFSESQEKAFGYSSLQLFAHLRDMGYTLLKIGEKALEEYLPGDDQPRWFNVLAIAGSPLFLRELSGSCEDCT